MRLWQCLVLSFACLAGLSACLTNPNMPPVLVQFDGGTYPPEARAQGLEGVVRLRYTVDVEGRVRDPVVVSASPDGVFDEAALAAVRSWLFRPARQRGELISVELESSLEFRPAETDDYPRR